MALDEGVSEERIASMAVRLGVELRVRPVSVDVAAAEAVLRESGGPVWLIGGAPEAAPRRDRAGGVAGRLTGTDRGGAV